MIDEELENTFTFLLDYLYYNDLVWTKEVAMPSYWLSYEMHIVYQKFGWYYLLQDKFALMLGYIQCPLGFSFPRNI